MTEMHFFYFKKKKPKKYHAWSCQNVCDALTFLLDNSFIRFGTKLYRQVVGIPMGTNCAPSLPIYSCFVMRGTLLCLFLIISRLMLLMLKINNVYFDTMVSQIYPSELQLNKANTSDTEAVFLDLHLSISNDIVSTKIYDKRDDFEFPIVRW